MYGVGRKRWGPESFFQCQIFFTTFLTWKMSPTPNCSYYFSILEIFLWCEIFSTTFPTWKIFSFLRLFRCRKFFPTPNIDLNVSCIGGGGGYLVHFSGIWKSVGRKKYYLNLICSLQKVLLKMLPWCHSNNQISLVTHHCTSSKYLCPVGRNLFAQPVSLSSRSP